MEAARRSALGIGVLAVALAYLLVGLTYPMGTIAQPGPGVYPAGVGMLLVAASARLCYEQLRHSPPVRAGESHQTTQGALARIGVNRALILLLTLVYAVALPYLGYALTALGIAIVLLRATGMKSWTATILTAAGFAAGSHLIFVVWLGLPLPAGPLPDFR